MKKIEIAELSNQYLFLGQAVFVVEQGFVEMQVHGRFYVLRIIDALSRIAQRFKKLNLSLEEQ